MKRWLIMVGFVAVLVAVIGGLWGYNLSKKMATFKAMGEPKFTVSTLRAATQPWRQQLKVVGSLHALRGADLSSEVAGIIDAIHFESGSDVKAGVLLAELRAADDIGKLESLRANAQLATANYQRAVAQLDAQAISKAELDAADAAAKSAQAQVVEQQALVNKKRIYAPFAGQLGIRNADPGQYVAAGTKIVTLQTLDPIHADFYVPQQQLAALRVGQTVSATSDTFPGQIFNGRITAIDPKVDTDTRNVQVRATLQNPKRQLLPGMYTSLNIEVGKPESFITVPLTAIAYNPYGATVYLAVPRSQQQADIQTKTVQVDAGKALVAKQVFVTPGATRGDQVAVVKGLHVGDEVVTSGQLKLKNGAPIDINNAVQPANDPNPHPVQN
jgi:membrane fusion protein (multidrug efflux system)